MEERMNERIKVEKEEGGWGRGGGGGDWSRGPGWPRLLNPHTWREMWPGIVAFELSDLFVASIIYGGVILKRSTIIRAGAFTLKPCPASSADIVTRGRGLQKNKIWIAQLWLFLDF